MLFNFYLANHDAGGVKRLRDAVAPLHHGLVEAGHHVIDFGLALALAPAINLLVENFSNTAVTDGILKLKAEQGDRLRFGIVCPSDIDDRDPSPRLANLRRLAPVADFVWSFLPQTAIETTHLELGFSERLLNRQPIATAALRDLDVLVIGRATPYRAAAADALRRGGLGCYVTGDAPLPGFALDDLVRRAKVLLDLRCRAGADYASPLRAVMGLHGGTLVASEKSGRRLGRLDDYVLLAEPQELVERCAAVVRSGMAVDMGLAALAKFRAETSMRQIMIDATRGLGS
jgi:hypothetical protein